MNGKVVFSGWDANGNNGLWVTDGTGTGTSEVEVAGGTAGISPGQLTPYNGGVLFTGDDANGGWGLWVTDGTVAGTCRVAG